MGFYSDKIRPLKTRASEQIDTIVKYTKINRMHPLHQFVSLGDFGCSVDKEKEYYSLQSLRVFLNTPISTSDEIIIEDLLSISTYLIFGQETTQDDKRYYEAPKYLYSSGIFYEFNTLKPVAILLVNRIYANYYKTFDCLLVTTDSELIKYLDTAKVTQLSEIPVAAEINHKRYHVSFEGNRITEYIVVEDTNFLQIIEPEIFSDDIDEGILNYFFLS